MKLQRIQTTAAAALLAVMLMALAAPLALAGGWATVTLDQLPRQPRAGETLALSFTIRQHGLHEIDLDTTVNKVFVFASNPATGETLRFDARKDGNTGHFLVDVTFTAAGDWNWGVQPGWFPKVVYEPLTVLPPVAPQSAAFAQLASALQLNLPLCFVLATGVVALPQPADAIASSAGDIASSNVDQVAYGKALFVAKGCSGCHIHAGVTTGAGGPMIGPILTDRREDPQFLRTWLVDPAAMRPGTTMPNLGLDGDEIEALVAFLAQG